MIAVAMSIGLALPRIEDPDEVAKLIVQQYHLEHGNNDGGGSHVTVHRD